MSFKKIVSSLPFSPSLIGQLAFYAQRLKKEQWLRRLGLIFTIFALVIQSLAVFNPPESANASSSSDMVSGGCYNISCFLNEYDDEDSNVGFWSRKFGITRDEIADMWSDSICGSDWGVSFGMTNPGWNPYSLKRGGRTIHYGEGSRAISGCGSGFTGESDHAGEFSFINNCGNLQLQDIPDEPEEEPEEEEEPEPPYAECKEINVTPKSGISDETVFTITSRGSAYNGASFTGFRYDWAGASTGTTGVQPINNNSNRWTMKFDSAGDYRIRAYLNSTAGSNLTADSCVVPITVEPKKSEFDLSKSVSSVEAKPGETLEYTLVFKNTGNIALTGVTIKDSLPEGVTLVDEPAISPATGSTGDLFSDEGLVIDRVAVGGVVTITFNVKIDEATDFECGLNTLTNKAISTTNEYPTETDETNNQVTTTVDRNCDCSDTEISNDNPECETKKTAINTTQNNTDATEVTANGGDKIIFTITAVNRSKDTLTTDIVDAVQDTLEYSDILDYGGGALEERDGAMALVWKNVTIESGQSVSRTFSIVVKNPVPSIAHGQGAPNSYDCKMTNSVVIDNDNNATIDINVNCPSAKVVERVVAQLPATGAGSNIVFGGIIIAVVAFFYTRSRQLGKEVRLVRREFNSGSL